MGTKCTHVPGMDLSDHERKNLSEMVGAIGFAPSGGRTAARCLKPVGPPTNERRAKVGRGDWIRTSDPLRPRQVRYQAALRPDPKTSILSHPVGLTGRGWVGQRRRRTQRRLRRTPIENAAAGFRTKSVSMSPSVKPASFAAGMNAVNTVSNGRNAPPRGCPT